MDKKEKLVAEAKEAYNGNLYFADYKFVDKEKSEHHLQFVYREPTEEEIEGYSSQARLSQMGANRQLMHKLIVAPKAAEVMDEIGEYPAPVTTFIQEYVNPLGGLIKEVKTFEKL